MQNKLPKTTYSSSITTGTTHQDMDNSKIIFYYNNVFKNIILIY